MSNVMQSSAILPQVRGLVRDRLQQIPNFAMLPQAERAALAADTVNALAYILGGEDGKSQPEVVALDQPALPSNPAIHVKQDFQDLTKEDAGDTAADRLKKSGGDILKAGTEALGDAVAKVDFPKFVGGLIDGVFNAINNSTMAQLKAYAELVKNVSKSVEQFMTDNVSHNDARNQLANQYPNVLGVGAGDRGEPKLTVKDDADEQAMPAMFKDLGLPADTSLDDDTVEEKVVPGMRRRMALDRQQMLATMVMMGVNRLVVTDGSIDASVLFELKASATDKRSSKVRGSYGAGQYASNYDNRSTETSTSSGGGIVSFFGGTDTNTQDNWYRGHYDSDSAQFSVSTSHSDDSSAKLDLHTRLTGKVHVNFKSDYFPMEKMLDVMALNVAKEKAMTPDTGAAKPAANTPVAPPAPPLPVTTPAPAH